MKKLKIVSFGDPVLRQSAKPVSVFHHKLHSAIGSIAKTLEGRDDGAALAATQVSILKRITVIDYEGEYLELINPEILSASGEQTDYEGCLSFSGYYGRVTRAMDIQVKYHNRNGDELIINRSGKMARCIQHEIDHLDGILFVDRMIDDFLLHSDTNEKLSKESVIALANGNTTAVPRDLLL
jgi:peptide deformylase